MPPTAKPLSSSSRSSRSFEDLLARLPEQKDVNIPSVRSLSSEKNENGAKFLLRFMSKLSSRTASPKRRYILKLKDGANVEIRKQVQELLGKLNCNSNIMFEKLFFGFTFEYDGARLPIEQLNRISWIELIEEDSKMKVKQVQSEAPWGLSRLNSADGSDGNFAFQLTGKDVDVFVVDSGIDIEHSELKGRAKLVYQAPSITDKYSDCTGHGTHVSSIIAGTNTGVAKEANIYSVRVVGCNDETLSSETIAALEWIVKNKKGPTVVNMSLGPSVGENGLYVQSKALDVAISKAVDAGVIVVVAAGNDGTDACSGSPANSSGSITVGATDKDNNRASFSNYGPCVKVFAPGNNIVAAKSGGGYTMKSGTSQAAPFVAGVVATYLQKNPNATSRDVLKAIQENGLKDTVKDAKDSQPVLLQSIDKPKPGTAEYEKEYVKLGPAGVVPNLENSDGVFISNGSLTTLGVVSIVLSSLVVAAVLFGILCFCLRKKKRNERRKSLLPLMNPSGTFKSKIRQPSLPTVLEEDSMPPTPVQSSAQFDIEEYYEVVPNSVQDVEPVVYSSNRRNSYNRYENNIHEGGTLKSEYLGTPNATFGSADFRFSLSKNSDGFESTPLRLEKLPKLAVRTDNLFPLNQDDTLRSAPIKDDPDATLKSTPVKDTGPRSAPFDRLHRTFDKASPSPIAFDYDDRTNRPPVLF